MVATIGTCWLAALAHDNVSHYCIILPCPEQLPATEA